MNDTNMHQPARECHGAGKGMPLSRMKNSTTAADMHLQHPQLMPAPSLFSSSSRVYIHGNMPRRCSSAQLLNEQRINHHMDIRTV